MLQIPCSYTQRQFLATILNSNAVDTVCFGGACGGKTFVSCLTMVLRPIIYAGTSDPMTRFPENAV